MQDVDWGAIVTDVMATQGRPELLHPQQYAWREPLSGFVLFFVQSWQGFRGGGRGGRGGPPVAGY